MKKIEAIIQPTKLDAVCAALENTGSGGIMITEIQGHGKQKGLKQQWRGTEYKVAFLPKTKIEVVVKDQDVEKVIKAIIAAARTGEIGDGKIFISSIDEAVRVRTGERGDVAL